EYYPSGKVKCQRNFVNNNEIGRTVYFFETGTIKEVQHYENGKRIDFDTVFYKSGKVRFVSEFKDGVNNGIFKEYDETGAVLDEQMFENGKRLEK
ncbi:MAG: hypothetical protein KDC04_00590, partial [Saprospiraceae bacterium]|nr:hypothetical protein [Saprospiraceae bacterium]